MVLGMFRLRGKSFFFAVLFFLHQNSDDIYFVYMYICEEPFENPSFFQRGNKPFCEPCFSIMLRNQE